jgi:hypothetical protein
MKTQITTVLILLSGLVYAQIPDYLSNDPNWRQDWYFGGSMPCLQIHNYIYYLNGDSIISDVAYKKVYEIREQEYRWMAPPPHQDCDSKILSDEFRILLRQDGKKMYVFENGAEHLLYDFELSVGDTLPLNWNMLTEGIYVTGIDSIFMDDHYRKVFQLSDASGMENFLIEGVGSNLGLLEEFPMPMLNYPSNLLCFTLNGTTWFPGFGEDCDLTLNTPLLEQDFQFCFSPNPVKDRLRIDHHEVSNIKQVIVYDCYGRKLFVVPEKIAPHSLELDLSFLSQGLYILELQFTPTTLARIKVIKQ